MFPISASATARVSIGIPTGWAWKLPPDTHSSGSANTSGLSLLASSSISTAVDLLLVETAQAQRRQQPRRPIQRPAQRRTVGPHRAAAHQRDDVIVADHALVIAQG